MTGHSVIEFECYSCLHRISVTATDSGKQMECPQCHASQPVPSRSLDLALFDDIFESLGGERKSEESGSPGRSKGERESDVSPSQISASKPELTKPKITKPKLTKPERAKRKLVESGNSKSVPKQPFSADGIEKPASDTMFGFHCHICETRLHGRRSQIGSKVECPTCFTKLSVPPPKKKVTPDLLWGKSQAVDHPKFKSPVFNTDEFKLRDPIDRPPVSVPVDPSFGLEPVTDDLLAPVPNPLPSTDGDQNSGRESGIPMLEVLLEPEEKNLSRRQRYEVAQQRQIELEKLGGRRKGGATEKGNPARAPRPPFKSKKNADFSSRPPANVDEQATVLPTSAPELFDFYTLTKSVGAMFGSPGLMWRAIVSALLMGTGWAIMHAITASYQAVHQDSEAPIGEWAISMIVWFLFGGIPYLIGTLLLWFVCGYVYRESAHGRNQISGWATGGSSEFSSTFLIFAFGYFIAGLPMAFVSWLIVPFRFLFAPPLLLSAWFNQSPFAIIAVDAFQNVQRDWYQWKSFYLYVLALAGIALVGGLLMMIPIFILSAITSLIGAAILVSVTIAYTAVTGWQCSLVMKRLEK
jgi:hypothetical protein